jgi:ribosomal protein L11 methyltransferase
MNEWIEVSLTVDGEGAEAAADVLRRYTEQGIVIERSVPGGEAWPDEMLPSGPMTIKTYIPVDDKTTTVQRQIEEALYYVGRLYPIPAPDFRVIQEEDWAQAWKRDFKPIRVGKKLVIKPDWIEIETALDDIVIELDPGMAFGTGTHPTTQLCLQALEELVRPGMSLVDLGTGSGILSIAGAKLGSQPIAACDIDEVAVDAALQNIARNNVEDKIAIQLGSLETILAGSQRFDLGVANITANIILSMARHDIQQLVHPGGYFVFSGILEEQAAEVVEALAAADLILRSQRQMGEWIVLYTQRRER